MKYHMNRALTAAVLAASSGVVAAQTTPFVETFEGGTNGWFDAADQALTFNSTGASDGSAFVSTTLDVVSFDPAFGAIAFRGDADLGASGGAFTGDYVSGGIDTLSFDIKLDGAGPLGLYVRVSGPANFPSIIAFLPGIVAPGAWQTVSFDLTSNNPLIQIAAAPGTTVEDITSNVGNVQIGLSTVAGGPTAGFATVSIDNIAITPAPGAMALLGLGGFAAMRRRRRR
ncbi:MAG: PEP-CTERM sorting domain-containing protein [Planctomycetota bacterium]